MKRFVITTLVACSVCGTTMHIHPAINTIDQFSAQSVPVYKPDNTVFLVDFHHVLARFDVKEAWKNFRQHPKKAHLASRIFTYVKNKYVFPQLFKEPKESVLEFYLNKNEVSPETIQLNNRLVNSFTIDQKTLKLLKTLKNKGYKLILFSNMPDVSLRIQQQRHPDVFKLFDALWVRTANNKYSSKNDMSAFDQIKIVSENVLLRKPERYIFFDDNAGNISRATQAGICGILFTNAEQAEKKLKKMAIL